MACVILCALALFIITRLHMLHRAVSRLQMERANEEWLVRQCEHDEFYHNMRHHSKLCDEVSRKADDAVLLHAFRDVIEETHLCGVHSCLNVFEVVLGFLAQQSYHLVVFGVCLVILIPTLILPLWRRLLVPMVDGMADERMRRMYNAPYGIRHYTSTHPLMYSAHDDSAMYGPYPGGRKHV